MTNRTMPAAPTTSADAPPGPPPSTTGGPAFDAQVERSQTAATRGCADLGEVRAVVGRIDAADFGSWARAWRTMAETVRSEGDRSLEVGSTVSARRCYLRASEYYRQAFFFARDDLARPDLQADYRSHVETFRAAVPLLSHPVVSMSIELPGLVVTGYLVRPADDDRPRPTVLAPAGYDSTAEAGYADVAVSALEHGMNCLVFEGPGQGGVLYERHLALRPDFETVLRPVVDWVVAQRGVAHHELVLFGRSFAGYLAPRGTTGEPRIAALIADPAQYDFGADLRARLGDATWARLENDDPTLEADLATRLLTDPQKHNELDPFHRTPRLRWTRSAREDVPRACPTRA